VGVLELAVVKTTIRGHATHLQSPHRKARSPFRRVPSNLARYHRTSTGLTGHWNDRSNSRKTNRRVTNARPSPQSDTKSRRAEANQGNDPCKIYRGVPLSDRATTGRTTTPGGFTYEFRPPVPRISLTFYLAALQNVLCSEFASAQMLRDTNCKFTGFIGVDPHQDSSIALHTFLDGLVKCTWHETSSIWNEKKGKLFFIRMGWHPSLDASSGSREVARTEQNTLYTANDLGDPRIMSLQIDEKQVVGELCQLTNLNYRARHGGCLAQVGVRGRII
jgi:hypothetical protein